ncbi:MAG TPA: outer membrane beta-barrel protein [Rhizomicrobium sp.]|nr:outer membrane beta-barrel protein [Rhizomicrobium sp.]
MDRSHIAGILLAILSAVGGMGAALAEDINPDALPMVTRDQAATGALPEGKGVLDRARPEYDAVGVPIEEFVLYPTLALGGTYDDNVFRAPLAEQSDLYWTFSPRLDLRSQWQRHALQLYAQLDHYEFDELNSETRTNWTVGGAGRYDISDGSFLAADSYYLDTHESRTSPDLSTLALSPTAYQQVHADGSIQGQFGLTLLSGGVWFDRFDFDPTRLIGGGTINNDDRDRSVIEVFGKAAYEFAPDQEVFLRASYNTRDFDLSLDRNGFDRNSHGYHIDAGVEGMLTPVVRGSAFVGYVNQNYRAPLESVDDFDFGAQIDWFVTELFTAHLAASRTIADTTIFGASSVDERAVAASADYELLRNVILRANIGYSDDAFRGITRDDRIFTAGISGRYLINQYLSAELAFAHENRDSNVIGRDYDDNAFSFGLKVQI